MTGSFWAYLGVSILVIVTPGQDTALTIRNALLGGRRAGVATAVGVAAGQAVWALATSVGLVALLAASEPAFFAIKLAGAAYLVYLGIEGLAGALRAPGAERAPGGRPAAPRLSPRAALRQGVMSDLGNPKMAVFFTSLLPQFAPEGGASFAALFSLGLVFSALTFAWLAFYAAAVAGAGDFLRRTAVRRGLDALMGTVLVALGLRLAAGQR